jgi:hypothetical protein
MLDNALKGLLIALGLVLLIWAGVAAVRGAKRGSGVGAAMLAVFLGLFGSDAPPPHQAMEEARLGKDRNRGGNPGGDDDDPDADPKAN